VGGREPVNAQRYDAGGPGSGGAASHEGRPAGRGKRQRERRGDGVEDKKVETVKGIEEQRAFYTRAKRHEGAVPDLAELNPNRQPRLQGK
jgi:hypothetical protein